MGFFDDLFSSDGERPIAKITGRHISGFSLNNEAEITVQLFNDRIVFKSGSTLLSESDIDDILFVDGRYEDVETGSVIDCEQEVRKEIRYFLHVDTFNSSLIMRTEDKDDLIKFVNECNNIINNYDGLDDDIWKVGKIFETSD